MDNKQGHITRILTGITYYKVEGKVYRVVVPSLEARAYADFVYRETLNDAKFSDLMTRDQATVFLNKNGIWTPKNDLELKRLQEYTDTLKMEMYGALYKPREQKKIRRRLRQVESGIERSLVKKYAVDYMTLEYHAEQARQKVEIALSIEHLDGSPVYTPATVGGADDQHIDLFIYLVSSQMLSQNEYREIARTEPFRSLWSVKKQDLFGSNMSDEQRAIILYSRMYDSVYEHPERPTEAVIADDDMLDGWFVKQQRDAAKERKKQEAESVLAKKGGGGAGETFVMAESPEEAQKIMDLNDLDGQRRIKIRESVVRERGRTEEQKLPDIQVDLQRQAIRGRKNG